MEWTRGDSPAFMDWEENSQVYSCLVKQLYSSQLLI